MPISRAALFLFALLAALPPARALRAESEKAEKDPLAEQAIAMANQGKFEDAIELLRADAAKKPVTVRQSIRSGGCSTTSARPTKPARPGRRTCTRTRTTTRC